MRSLQGCVTSASARPAYRWHAAVRGARPPPYSDGAWKTLSCLKREAAQWQESGGRSREIARLLFGMLLIRKVAIKRASFG